LTLFRVEREVVAAGAAAAFPRPRPLPRTVGFAAAALVLTFDDAELVGVAEAVATLFLLATISIEN